MGSRLRAVTVGLLFITVEHTLPTSAFWNIQGGLLTSICEIISSKLETAVSTSLEMLKNNPVLSKSVAQSFFKSPGDFSRIEFLL